jgi:MFS family permease
VNLPGLLGIGQPVPAEHRSNFLHLYLYIAWYGVLAASSMAIFAGATLAPALPAMRENFSDVPNIDLIVRLVLTLPALFIGLLSPFAGLIVDKLGRKPVLVVSLLVGSVAGLSGYFVDTLALLLAGRAILGIAVAGSMTSATTLIADYYEGPARSGFLGLQAGVMGLGGAFVLAVAGIMADISWRTPFLIYIVPLIVLPFVVLILYEPKLDQWCNEDVAALGDGAACAGAAARDDQSFGVATAQKEPVPYGLLAFIYGAVLVMVVLYFVIPIQLPFYLLEKTQASATQTGLTVSVATLSFALSSMFLAKRMSKLDHITVLLLGYGLMGIGMSFITVSEGSAMMYPGLIIAGIDIGIAFPNLYVWLANSAPLAIRGRALGGMNTALFLGQFISPIMAQPLVARFDIDGLFMVSAVLMLALVPIIFVSRGRIRSMTAAPA